MPSSPLSTTLITPFIQALSTYPAAQLRALQVLAVADVPFAITKMKGMVQAMKWNNTFINGKWRDQLLRDGVLEKKSAIETRLNPIIREALCQQAAIEKNYATIHTSSDKILRSDYYYRLDASIAKQRHALYEGKTGRIRQILQTGQAHFTPCPLWPDVYNDIICSPIYLDWLATLEDDIQFQFLFRIVDQITHKVNTCTPSQDDIRTFLEHAPRILAQPEGACLLATIHLWQGNLSLAENTLPAIDTPCITALRGRIAFFRGQTDRAQAYYDDAISQLRKTSNTRNVTLHEDDQVFRLLTCLKSNNGKLFRSIIRDHRRYNKKNKLPKSLIIEWMQLVLDIREQRAELDPKRLFDFADMNLRNILLIAFGLHWLDLLTKHESIIAHALMEMQHYSQCHHLDWVWWELDLLFPQLKSAKPGKTPLRTLKPYCSYKKTLPTTIRQRIKDDGFVSLLNLLPRQQPWQLGLQALKSLATPTTDRASGSREQRLAWLFTITDQTIHAVEPRHQTLSKQGRWGKGRKISLSRLRPAAERDSNFPFLTEQDRHICSMIRKDREYRYYNHGESYTINGYRALIGAVGHPFLFLNDMNTPLTINRGEVVLQVTKEKQNICICLHPFPERGAAQTRPLLRWDSPQQATLFTFTQEQSHIANILGEKGLSVPASAQEEALESIAAIAPLLTVHSTVEGAGQQAAREVEADSRLHLQLQPTAGGLQINCLVRPFTEAALTLRPGEGGHTVFTEHEGVTLQTRRDLTQEIKHSQTLLTACGHLEADQGWCWQLDDPQQALETLEQLQQLGEDEVMLEWPEGKKIGLSQRLDIDAFRVSMHKQQEWFEIEGEVAVGEDQVIDMKKLLSLVSASPGRFVRLDDNQFLSLSNALYQRLSSLHSITDQGRFHGLAAAAIDEITDGMKVRKNKHWQQHLQNISEAQAYTPELPSTLQAELRDYQMEGFTWLARLTHWGAGACLADDMGLGKTVQALALMLLHAPHGPILVVAPTSVCMNWESEIARFAPTLTSHNFAEGSRKQTVEHAGAFDVVLCSYALLQRNAEILTSRKWQMVVLDEAQAIKNGLTKRSKAAMALQAVVRIITTGTPIENHLGELWNLFQFINPGLLGSLDSFNERFANPIENHHDKAVSQRLKQLIHPFILRRLKSDVLTELPPRTEITIHVELSPEETALYEATRQRALERIAESAGENSGTQHLKVLAEITRLRRACCHPSLIMPDTRITGSKLAAFGECINELREGNHKALVFSQFVAHLTILRNYLDKKKIPYQYLDGSTPAHTRKKRVDAFQAGDGDLFLISLKAGGSGLNLTAADFVLHMDPWWNPAVEDQASDRAHRIGQTRPVTIYRFIAKNTIEDKIVQLHQQKRDLADSLLEGSDRGGKISLEEIMKLVEGASAT